MAPVAASPSCSSSGVAGNPERLSLRSVFSVVTRHELTPDSAFSPVRRRTIALSAQCRGLQKRLRSPSAWSVVARHEPPLTPTTPRFLFSFCRRLARTSKPRKCAASSKMRALAMVVICLIFGPVVARHEVAGDLARSPDRHGLVRYYTYRPAPDRAQLRRLRRTKG